MKNVFDRLVSRRNMAEERISELENMWIETKKLSEKRLGKKKREQTVQQLWGNYRKYNIPMMEHQTEKREKNKINIWTTNGLEFSQMSDARPQIQKLREKQTGKVWTKRNKKLQLNVSFQSEKNKIKDKDKKFEWSHRTPTLWRNKDKNYIWFLRNHSSKKSAVKYFKGWEENTTKLEFCILQNYPSKVKENLNISQLRKLVAYRTTFQEMLKKLLERQKMIQVRNSNLHKERKSIREGISKG